MFVDACAADPYVFWASWTQKWVKIRLRIRNTYCNYVIYFRLWGIRDLVNTSEQKNKLHDKMNYEYLLKLTEMT